MVLARRTSGLLERGILTSAVGIGDGYDELLLGGMAESGGGRLHDAEHAAEIAEVVMGELLEGRTALLQRTTLRFSVPANLRAEVVGGWSHTVLPGVIDVQVGALLPDTQTRVVFRLHCPELPPGSTLLLGAMARGTVPDGSGDMAAGPVETELGFGLATGNNAQPRDLDRSMAALQAWQAETLRRTMTLNRNGDRRGAKHYLERELRYMQRYAMGMAGGRTAAGRTRAAPAPRGPGDRAAVAQGDLQHHQPPGLLQGGLAVGGARQPGRPAAGRPGLMRRGHFAYGSNLCIDQMAARRRAAELGGSASLPGWRGARAVLAGPLGDTRAGALAARPRQRPGPVGALTKP